MTLAVTLTETVTVKFSVTVTKTGIPKVSDHYRR